MPSSHCLFPRWLVFFLHLPWASLNKWTYSDIPPNESPPNANCSSLHFLVPTSVQLSGECPRLLGYHTAITSHTLWSSPLPSSHLKSRTPLLIAPPHPRFMIDGKQLRSGLIKDRNVDWDFQSQCDSVPKQLPVFSRRPSRASGEGHPLSLYATAKGNEVEGRPKSLAATLAYLPAMFLPKVTQPLSKCFHMCSAHVYRAAENY